MIINYIRFKTISVKLTMIYALIFSLFLILLSTLTLYGIRYFLINQGVNDVNNISRIVLDNISMGKYNDLRDNVIVSELSLKEGIFIKITDEQGNLINSSNTNDIYRLPSKPVFNTARKIEEDGRHLIYKNSKIRDNAYLQVVNNMEDEYGFMKLLFVLLAIADAAGIVVSVLVGLLLSRRILKPIDKITKTAQSISVHDLNARIEVGTQDDELTRLANTFNDMIDRLKTSFERKDQFVSDASHELRTPISIIQGYINLLDRWGKDNRDVLQESIEAIKNEASNMMNLIERLLFLARSDSGTLKLEKQTFCLNELISDVVKESRIIAPNHQISESQNDTIVITADRRMLRQALRALIENSLKFTAENGTIELSAETDGDSIKIKVEDDGVGIPETEINKIFSRFYRVDKSRSKRTGGSGLGLSIVKWIVEAHEGSITVRSVLGKGTSIIITLPNK